MATVFDEEIINPNEQIHQKGNLTTCDDDFPADNKGEKRKLESLSPSDSPLYKTTLCSYFRRSSGSCSHGAACRYAHGESELRPRPDNSWDPTSELAKKTLKSSHPGNDNGDKNEEDEIHSDSILMTDFVAGNGGFLDANLSKCLLHLPRKWGSEQLNTFLNQSEVAFKFSKKKKGMTVGFVSFDNNEHLTAAVQVLEGKSAGNKNIKVADVVPRTYDEKIKSALSSNEAKSSIPQEENCEATEEGSSKGRTAREAVTPLADIPYANQLEQKKSSLSQLLKKLTRNARKACPNDVPLPSWILKSREIGGLPCELKGIIESPLVEGYRNKCEFSVGYSVLGKPTVGFLLGNFREGVTAVEEPTHCPNVSHIACKFASIFQDFLQNSDLPIWNRFRNSGFWRQLTVREGRFTTNLGAHEAEVMLIVQISSKDFEGEQKDCELEKVKSTFVVAAGAHSPPLPLTYVVLQDHQGISNVAPGDAPLSVLFPSNETIDARIHDQISTLKFSISPTAFFQVNTLAAEKLYALAGEWADLRPTTLLFDVCCGTGTIGLTLAHQVGLVVGIEMNPSAVEDAQRNAEMNGIKNCRFVSGKAEDVMGSLLNEYVGSLEESGAGVYDNVVAIVDPPRGGLHPTVIKTLRGHSQLRQIVYISCNPETLVANAIELCTPTEERVEKGNKGNRGWRRMSSAGLARHRAKSMPFSLPFSPVKAVAVDLFPHTVHCEMLMLFQRSLDN